MKPAWSVILLTTLIGAGQGLYIAIFLADTSRVIPREFVQFGSAGALVLLICGLGASFFHLGRPERAWRAASQWRTSWLSREVIVLPAFMGMVAVYAASESLAAGAIAAVLCLLLFLCTGMIYACIKFLQEWATFLTPLNYALLGTASGFTLATALAQRLAPELVMSYATVAIVVTVLGLISRGISLIRNSKLKPKSSLQSAIGIRHPKISQKAQGFMGGSFNTREFFHGANPLRFSAVKWGFLLGVFVLPIVLVLTGLALGRESMLDAAFVVQYLGLLAERWFFFAQANHPQNLYYQSIA